MKRQLMFFIFLFVLTSTFSKVQVDTVGVFAYKMKKVVKSVVIVPENYSKKRHYPVVYLLHGHGDNSQAWVNKVPAIKMLATQNQIIIVCPDGGYDSWYFDSPIDSTYQYESYIIKDLIPYIDQHYSTKTNREARAITGLSMGGHGALYLAFRNKNLFGLAGSMSGGVDLIDLNKQYGIAQRIGNYEKKPEEWQSRSVMNMINSLKNNDLKIIIDCGVDDFFYKMNVTLHERLLALKIDHDFTLRPGRHDFTYWKNAINYQLLYFKLNFK